MNNNKILAYVIIPHNGDHIQYTTNIANKYGMLTAWYFLEMNQFLVSPHGATGGEVTVDVTLLEPRIIISGEAVGCRSTRLLTGF